MRALIKTAAAILVGVTAIGFTAASADEHGRGRGGRDNDRHERHSDHDNNRSRAQSRNDNRYANNNRYAVSRPARCTLHHDHRIHDRNYYDFYPRDSYYNADPTFSLSVSFGDRGYYDRGGRYYDRYDSRGYRNDGRVVNREVYNIRGYRASAVLTEEVYGGGRYGNLICTVTARGPDARYVPYGQLRRIAANYCSPRAQIRVYA